MISFALKTPLEIRWGICIYKMSFLHRPDDYIGFIPSCPPHILQQKCAHDAAYYISLITFLFIPTVSGRIQTISY